MQQGLALFDFDGTITSKDSLLEFIKYTSGKFGFLLVMAMFSPIIFYYVLIKKDGEIAKRKVLSFLFKGKSKEELEQLGKSFAQEVIPSILLPAAIEEIEVHKKRRDRVVVISASLENWLKPWADSMKLELICTEMEYKDGKFSGRFATPNCNGQEKVNRIKSYLDLKQYKPVFAYGNSAGDKPMLAMADHGFYRLFE
jgi:HAD superfamily hydrolase (TIGR01490 family)